MKNQLDEAVHEAMASHEIPDELVLAFAPLHKRAFGMALGAAFGGMLFLVTVVALVVPGPRPNLALLAQYFAGYSVSWPGAFAGLAWGAFVGFVMGWFTAYSRNFVMAAQIWFARARQELGATRDFLDHI
jgi:hypothetical protein